MTEDHSIISDAQIAELVSIKCQLDDVLNDIRVRQRLTQPDDVDVKKYQFLDEEVSQIGAWSVRDCYNLGWCVYLLLDQLISGWMNEIYLHHFDVPAFSQKRYHQLLSNVILVRTRLLVVFSDPKGFQESPLITSRKPVVQATPAPKRVRLSPK